MINYWLPEFEKDNQCTDEEDEGNEETCDGNIDVGQVLLDVLQYKKRKEGNAY